MIKILKQAQAIQERRVKAGKAGYAKAVRDTLLAFGVTLASAFAILLYSLP